MTILRCGLVLELLLVSMMLRFELHLGLTALPEVSNCPTSVAFRRALAFAGQPLRSEVNLTNQFQVLQSFFQQILPGEKLCGSLESATVKTIVAEQL